MIETHEEVFDLTIDFVFKEILTRKACRPYLASIIHICTGIDKKYILKNMVLSNTNVPLYNRREKRSSSDIIVEVNDLFINVEMNRELLKGTINKNNSYIYKYRIEDFIVGEDYGSEKLYIQINIDNYQRFKGKEKFIYTVKLVETETLEEEDKNLVIYHINLAYLNKKRYNELKEEEKQFLIFKEKNIDKLMEIYRDNKEVKKVVNELMEMWWDENGVLCYGATASINYIVGDKPTQ